VLSHVITSKTGRTLGNVAFTSHNDGHSSNSNGPSRVLSDGQQLYEVGKTRFPMRHNAALCVSTMDMI
jgi:hypothetical protein